MSNEKKYTAQEAAVMVLKKAEELLKKSEVLKKGDSGKTKHDRCVEHVKENSPEIKNPHAVCVAQGVEPEAWKKSEGQDVTPPDEVQAQPAPEDNPDEKKENNNPPWGTDPGIKGHVKLAKFCGYMQAKREAKNGAK